MKTPYEIEVTIKQLEEGKFDENIIHFCKNKKKLEMLFEYLYEYEKIIKIKVDPNNINFNFLYCLDILITYESEFINFFYSQNFISCAIEYIKSYIIFRSIIIFLSFFGLILKRIFRYFQQ